MRKNSRREVRISGEPPRADRLCTFQVHSRRRVGGRIRPVESRSVPVVNVSLADGLRIVRLGIEAFRAERK